MKIIISITLLINLLFLSNFSNGQIVNLDSKLQIKDSVELIDPVYKGKIELVKEIKNKFQKELGQYEYFGCEIFISKNGLPSKVVCTSIMPHETSKRKSKLAKEIEKYVFKNCRWNAKVRPKVNKSEFVISESILYIIKDFP
jgi:hypothetical protein